MEKEENISVQITNQDVPSLFLMKSKSCLVLRPNRAPNAIASAAAAM